MALSYVLRPCPMSYDPVQVARSLDKVKFWGPMSYALDQMFVPSHFGPTWLRVLARGCGGRMSYASHGMCAQ